MPTRHDRTELVWKKNNDGVGVNIIEDKEAMGIIDLLRRRGFSGKQVRDAMTVLDLCAKDEASRIWALTGVQKPLAEVECGIRWVHAYGAVWCIRSSTQCDYCGPLSTWKMPQHAKAHPVVMP